MHYNFCCIHKKLGVTPAMAAGVTHRPWEISDIARVWEAWEADRALAAVRALEEEHLQMETLNRTAELATTKLDLEKLVQSVTDAGAKLIGAQFGAFFYNVVNERGESYMLSSISGVPRESFSKFPMPRNTHVFDPTFHGAGPVRSNDITNDPRYGQNAPYRGMPEGHLPVSHHADRSPSGSPQFFVRRPGNWMQIGATDLRKTPGRAGSRADS